MSAWSINWGDPETTLLVLLLCGSLSADFLIQMPKDLQGRRPAILRALVVALVQGALVLPVAKPLIGLPLVSAISIGHGALDRFKVWLDRSLPRKPLLCLLFDQSAKIGFVLLAWQACPTDAVPSCPRWFGEAAILIAVIALNGNGGSLIVRGVLAGLDSPDSEDEGPKGAGKKIGMLERWMILGLVWAGQWGAVGLVLTAKSVARFKKMDDKAFAETYLIGTMTSVIVAMVTGQLLRLLLKGT